MNGCNLKMNQPWTLFLHCLRCSESKWLIILYEQSCKMLRKQNPGFWSGSWRRNPVKRWGADKTGIHLRLQNILLPLVAIQNCQPVSIRRSLFWKAPRYKFCLFSELFLGETQNMISTLLCHSGGRQESNIFNFNFAPICDHLCRFLLLLLTSLENEEVDCNIFSECFKRVRMCDNVNIGETISLVGEEIWCASWIHLLHPLTNYLIQWLEFQQCFSTGSAFCP